jgi:dynein heavy chain
MVPDREIIMKVKLCAVGYEKFPDLARKFATLYAKSEMQLSKQKHYDFGLRNILSVLRTAGAKKRAELQADEFMLLYRTLRDMNLSKMVAQDVPLFLSLLKDLFPGIPPPPKAEAKELEEQLERFVNENELVQHEDWKLKVVQFHDTLLVRHGIMLVGPTGGGKSTIMRVLTQAREVTDSVQIKHSRLNPKAIRAAEMYGEVDALSGEWVTGVFASMWTKCNRRDNSHMSWLICDGPVDAIWIEVQQLALIGSSSSLHSEACNALGASDGVIHSSISRES